MDTVFVSRFMLFVAAIGIPVTSSFSTTSTDDATILADFVAVGTVEGKTYFAERSYTGSWIACESFCNASGMHLATITSAEQRSVLDNATFPVWQAYWTGGRDSLTPSQFSWNFNEGTLNNNFTTLDSYNPVLTCVNYYAQSDSPNVLRSLACSLLLRPLCEFIHG